MRNVTEQCVDLLAPNRSEPPGAEHLDAAACLFLTILPLEGSERPLAALFSLLVVLSLLVNGITMFGLERSHELSWQPRFNLLKNLILSDLIQTATFGPPLVYSLLQKRTMGFNLWCYLQYFWGTTTISASLLTIMCMTFERYLYVCHAIRYLSILTALRMRLALSVIWVVSVGLGVTGVALLQRDPDSDSLGDVTSGLTCEPDTIERFLGFPRASAIFRKVMAVLLLLTCSLVHSFAYLRMYQDARNAVVPFLAVNNRARKTVLFYSCMLIFQLLPVLIKASSDALWELKGNGAMISNNPHASSPPAVVLHVLLVGMVMVPPCINPLVYGLRNKEVRQVLAGLLRCLDTCSDPFAAEERRARKKRSRSAARAAGADRRGSAGPLEPSEGLPRGEGMGGEA